MHGFEKWLIGFTYAIAFLKNNSDFLIDGQGLHCGYADIKQYPGERGYTTCIHTLTEVPQDLNASIVFLNLSRNPTMNLRGDSFTRYIALKWLTLDHNTEGSRSHDPIVEETVFLPLINLDGISLMSSVYNKYFKWPAQLQALYFDENDPKYLSPLTLPRLLSLALQDSNIQDIPELSDTAPLRYLRIYDNPFEKLTAESLARFCLLDYLGCNFTTDQPEHYCRCSRIHRWVTLHKLNATRIICNVPNPPTCSYDFSEAFAIRWKCLQVHGLTSAAATWLYWGRLLIVVFIVFLIISLILYGVLVYIKKHKNLEAETRDEVESASEEEAAQGSEAAQESEAAQGPEAAQVPEESEET